MILIRTLLTSHRFSLGGEDLNRCWIDPDVERQPEVFHTKELVHFLANEVGKRPVVFCDIHGHTRKKNFFIFGCASSQSWLRADRVRTDVEHKFEVTMAILRTRKPEAVGNSTSLLAGVRKAA